MAGRSRSCEIDPLRPISFLAADEVTALYMDQDESDVVKKKNCR
jgi:hypothetical protein